MRSAAVPLLVLLLAPGAAFAGVIDAGVQIYVNPTGNIVRSNADATYYPNPVLFPGQMGTAPLSGRHWIQQTIPSIAFERPVTGMGYYIGTVEAPGIEGKCYFARIHAEAAGALDDEGTGVQCAPGGQVSEGDDDCVPSEWFACPPRDDPNNLYCNGPCVTSPVILSLDRGRYRLTDVARGVRFDLDADGEREKTAWTAAGERLAFLAIDLNGNGTIDSGHELFGDRTRMMDGSPAPNGFVALAQYDVDGDGEINARDGIWSALRLWIDANHDGVSQPPEVTPIDSSVIAGLRFDFRTTGGRDPHGNLFRYRARARYLDGERSYYDIFFVTN